MLFKVLVIGKKWAEEDKRPEPPIINVIVVSIVIIIFIIIHIYVYR